MKQRDLINYVYDVVAQYVPPEGEIFNLSLDFVVSGKVPVRSEVHYKHHGRKTSVLDVGIFDADNQVLVKALATILVL